MHRLPNRAWPTARRRSTRSQDGAPPTSSKGSLMPKYHISAHVTAVVSAVVEGKDEADALRNFNRLDPRRELYVHGVTSARRGGKTVIWTEEYRQAVIAENMRSI